MGTVERWLTLILLICTAVAGAWRANRMVIKRLDTIDGNTAAWQEMRTDYQAQKLATEANTRAIEKLTERLDRNGLV